MWQRFLSLIDWAARLHFLGTALWGGGAWAVTFFSTSAQGWDASSVWLASIVAGAGVAIIYIAIQLHRGPTSSVKTKDPLTRERILIAQLRDYKAEHSHAHVHIHFVTPRRPVAESLKNSFKDAGWQTDISQRAYETFVFNEFPKGIEVRGINSHFARAISQLLVDGGCTDAKPVVKSTKLTPSAENWQQANAGLMIVVGYSEDRE
jgi:hypothetical protein